MLGELRRRLESSLERLDQVGLQDRYQGLDLTPVDQAAAREPVRVGGVVEAVQVVDRAGVPTLEVAVNDGSGTAIAVFTGCRHLGGVERGRALVLEGVGRGDVAGLVLLNPGYTLLPDVGSEPT